MEWNHFGQRPADAFALKAKIKEENVACTCDRHQPSLYEEGACNNTHSKVRYDVEHNCDAIPPKLLGQNYEALHLARAAIRYFSVPLHQMNLSQRHAQARFLRYKTKRESPLQKLGWRDGYKALATADVMPILKIFNELFFFGTVEFAFKWSKLEDDTLGQCKGRIIELSHTNTDYYDATISDSVYKQRAVSRLSTLLHELTHAYLMQYVCMKCPTATENHIQARGHGRAFMNIAVALEGVSFALLGVQLKLMDEYEYIIHWHDVYYLPSKHDARKWKWLVEETLEETHREDSMFELFH
jgi:hypothetical protein